MANEAVLVVKKSDPIDFTILNTTAVEKGAICNMYSPRSTSGSSVVPGDEFSGINFREKIASDGTTSVALFRDGVFRCKVATGGTVTVGQHVTMSGANLIRTATEAEIAAGSSIGIALETKTGDLGCEVAVGE